MTNKEFIKKWWDALTDDEVCILVYDAFDNEYLPNLDPYELPHTMEEFDDYTYDLSSYDVAQSVVYGDFRPSDPYWAYDVSGNFVSYPENHLKDAYIKYMNGIARYMEESGATIDEHVNLTNKNRPHYEEMWKDYCMIKRVENDA